MSQNSTQDTTQFICTTAIRLLRNKRNEKKHIREVLRNMSLRQQCQTAFIIFIRIHTVHNFYLYNFNFLLIHTVFQHCYIPLLQSYRVLLGFPKQGSQQCEFKNSKQSSPCSFLTIFSQEPNRPQFDEAINEIRRTHRTFN